MGFSFFPSTFFYFHHTKHFWKNFFSLIYWIFTFIHLLATWCSWRLYYPFIAFVPNAAVWCCVWGRLMKIKNFFFVNKYRSQQESLLSLTSYYTNFRFSLCKLLLNKFSNYEKRWWAREILEYIIKFKTHVLEISDISCSLSLEIY